MSAAWVMTAGLLVGALGGRWLDAKLGSTPLLLLLGVGIGILAGFYEIVRVSRASTRDPKR